MPTGEVLKEKEEVGRKVLLSIFADSVVITTSILNEVIFIQEWIKPVKRNSPFSLDSKPHKKLKEISAGSKKIWRWTRKKYLKNNWTYIRGIHFIAGKTGFFIILFSLYFFETRAVNL